MSATGTCSSIEPDYDSEYTAAVADVQRELEGWSWAYSIYFAVNIGVGAGSAKYHPKDTFTLLFEYPTSRAVSGYVLENSGVVDAAAPAPVAQAAPVACGSTAHPLHLRHSLRCSLHGTGCRSTWTIRPGPLSR